MEKEISIKVNARHVGQLGRELVTDYVTALTELVKNSYDADGEGVEVAFTNMLSGEGKIIIADTGCGFSSDDIETKWAVIGTSSKVKNPYSKKYKRRCVGRKGIGRYSVERLAEYCTLYSFTKDNRPVKYYMNWNKYEGIDFNELKQRVEILENSPDFESAKYIKRAVEYLLVSERIDIDSKNIIREKILKNNKKKIYKKKKEVKPFSEIPKEPQLFCHRQSCSHSIASIKNPTTSYSKPLISIYPMILVKQRKHPLQLHSISALIVVSATNFDTLGDKLSRPINRFRQTLPSEQ